MSQNALERINEGTTSEVDIGSDELLKTEDGVKSTVSDIMKRHFPKSPNVTKCKTCDWKHFCNKESD